MPFEPTYLEFHALFVLPPVVALAWRWHRRRREGARRPGQRAVLDGGRAAAGRLVRADFGLDALGLLAILFAAVVYTVPWDNALIAVGVWTYGPGRVAATLWHAPVGEYLFFLAQPTLTALFLAALPREWSRTAERTPVASPRRLRVASVGLAAAIGAAGVAALASPPTLYLGAILAWAAPVFALQWAVGAPALVARRRLVAAAVCVPTLYLCVADRVAIDAGIWSLSPTWTTGRSVFGLPVEEALFFLVTNLFVVQGLVLYRWVTETGAADQLRRTVRSWR
ncbi:lycopene cyclase domain-containing protein [Halobaculum sp. D14]|uniref:lycopene cyclase domain-containing protein n=1 Tax=Halobaculum sp. D14 TaxID=3421642 RepID=UPI003EBF12D0